ncbi:MAG: helix-turn-helix domain-containing protein [Lactobacillus sp.]|jgi:transcriptional regulator with XRE-family HTH domain|nr:helix-turn-helix domain-containing protein [Lactobacillus sp.]MCI2032099.1 helix-turn-helix domain-containing protein [Lactobacillus sp.]
MTLFERIKKISSERGFALTEVARRAGIGEKSVYAWKPSKAYPDGITPRRETLEKVANVLHVSVDYLLGNTDDPNPPRASDKKPMTKNQELIAYSIDPDISDDEREAIIEMVKQAMKFRKRL